MSGRAYGTRQPVPESLPSAATPRLALGTADLGNLRAPMLDANAAAIVDCALDSGITDFDTAPLYGLGLSEQRLGRALSDVPRSQYRLSTKVGRVLRDDPSAEGKNWGGFYLETRTRPFWDFSQDGIRSELRRSLDRLRVDFVDSAFLHDPQMSGDPDAVERGIDVLSELKAEGLVGSIGVASKDTAALSTALDTGRVDALMIPGRLTIMNREALPIAERAASADVAVWNAAPFAGGLLAAKDQSPVTLSEREQATLRVIERVSNAEGVSMLTAALRFAAGLKGVQRVVVGAATSAQVAANVASWSTAIDPSYWRRLDAELGGLD